MPTIVALTFAHVMSILFSDYSVCYGQVTLIILTTTIIYTQMVSVNMTIAPYHLRTTREKWIAVDTIPTGIRTTRTTRLVKNAATIILHTVL